VIPLQRPGSTRSRRVLLLGGLAALAIVNYLDLVGVLGMGRTNDLVGWIATRWAIVIGLVLDPDEEMFDRLNDLLRAFVGRSCLEYSQ